MDSSSSSSSSPPNFSSLPVMALKDRIVDKISQNRVTLIIGETGCGKSSQVPQFLLQEGMEPILCTQPRRFAVVAVARMVAQARGCEVGGEVGYHIGHCKVMSERSKIIFKTAGVLLDEMRDKGIDALRYKVVILDEVHERSVESDLVLAFIKQFLLKKNDLRVVLMSATADITRYKDYFRDLGRGERVEVLAIPSSPKQVIFQRRVSYLEQVTELLGMDELFLADYISEMERVSSRAQIKAAVHKLIHDLVMHIHENEPDIEKSILVFLPTYHSLEQQWSLLKSFSSCFEVHILHRSIDTDKALMAMKICKSHRKVILATNIAESSVTIPGVAFVIDSCRSLQVFWDNSIKRESVELVWVSKSQADQRKGRTGRTCDGQIYRLVPRSFYGDLCEHESPSILRLSLRKHVLLIASAESRAINDPKVLLERSMDAPDPEVVEDALNLLVHIQALEKPTIPRGRYEPTFYGRILATLSLSFDASVLILKFGEIGLLREGILVGILMDQQPLPIVHPFGQENLFSEYLDSYFTGDNEDVSLPSRREVILMANLCAYQFWQRVLKDKQRLDFLKEVPNSNGPKAAELMLSKLEEEWCSFHNLVQSSLNHVSEMYEDIINAIHRFRPRFLSTSNGLPSYYDPSEFKHSCLIFSPQDGGLGPAPMSNKPLDRTIGERTCVAVPFVPSDYFQSNLVAENFANIIKEIRIQCTEDFTGKQQKNMDSIFMKEAPLCKFFANGLCNKGSQCSFSHSRQSKLPVCRFFLSAQGCRNGGSCLFSHDIGPCIESVGSSLKDTHFFSHDSVPSSQSVGGSLKCLPEDEHADADAFLSLLPCPDQCSLIFDDVSLDCSTKLSQHMDPTRIIATTSLPPTYICDSSLLGARILWGIRDPCQAIVSNSGENCIPWTEVGCVLWFAKFVNNADDMNENSGLLKKFFECLAIRILADSLYELSVVLVMNNISFSQLQVEKLARDCFFFLAESFPFNESALGEFPDRIDTRKAMTVSRPVSYVFELHPPSDFRFGDYAATLYNCMHHETNGYSVSAYGSYY